jgi:uncharacterized damage-inducible protein DinB
MRIAEVLLTDFDFEIANTRRTLERIPANLAEYKPHEKSMPMGRLAMHCATMPLFGCYILEDDSMDLAAPKRPHADLTFKSQKECLATLDESAAKFRAALEAVTDEHLQEKWPFTWGEHTISNESRLLTYRQLFFNHLVHHTAQLGVYLRLNNLPVPALYGPSADEQWSPK